MFSPMMDRYALLFDIFSERPLRTLLGETLPVPDTSARTENMRLVWF